jgi:hypothetical protein
MRERKSKSMDSLIRLVKTSTIILIIATISSIMYASEWVPDQSHRFLDYYFDEVLPHQSIPSSFI